MRRSIGIVLILLGIAGLFFREISYTTEKEIADVGPLELKKEERKTIPLPPILGGLTVVAGVALVTLGGSVWRR